MRSYSRTMSNRNCSVWKIRTDFPQSFPRKRGPIRRGLKFGTMADGFLKQWTPVVMGPCFRRDDV
jgi:hypothetical protein